VKLSGQGDGYGLLAQGGSEQRLKVSLLLHLEVADQEPRALEDKDAAEVAEKRKEHKEN
jgi:hypothetical protein